MANVFKIIVFISFFIFQLSAFASEQKTLTVVLDWFINPNHAPLFVALQEGFFEESGLRIKFIVPLDVTEGEKMVAAKRADIALTYQPALLLHAVRGLPLMRFATLIDSPLGCLITAKNYSIKDLKGKRIGYSGTEIEHLVFSTVLKTVNLSIDEVQLINVKFNLVSALLTNQIDGFVGGMRNFEPVAIDLAGKSVQVFYPEQYGFPKYDELILVAHKDKIHNPDLVKFIYALQKGVDYLKKNPQKSWEKFAALHPELNNALNKRTWFKTMPYFANNPSRLDKNRYKKFGQFMWEGRLIECMPKISEYAIELK